VCNRRSDTEGEGSLIGSPHQSFNVGQCVAPLRGSTAYLVHDEGAGDSTALVLLLRRRRRDVVGHVDARRLNSASDQALLSRREVETVAGVVAEGQHHTGTGIRRPRDAVDLLGRR